MLDAIRTRESALLASTVTIAVVGSITVVGVALKNSGVIDPFYASPYVIACMVAGYCGGMRTGLLAAALSILANNVLFSGVDWHFNPVKTERYISYASMLAAAAIASRLARKPVVPSAGAQTPIAAMTETGFAAQSEIGRRHALRIARDVAYSQNPSILTAELRKMGQSGTWTAVDAGFAYGLASILANHHADNRQFQAKIGISQVEDDVSTATVGVDQARSDELP